MGTQDFKRWMTSMDESVDLITHFKNQGLISEEDL